MRDFQGHPVAAAKVLLRPDDGTLITPATTTPDGTYNFSSLKPGTYMLTAEKPGYADAKSGPIQLTPGDTKRLDLVFVPPKSANPQNPSQPEFFDEPQFTVAGVSDTTSYGGHGSDTVRRTTETLAKETASLTGKSPDSPAATPSTAKEKSLREAAERNPGSFDANHQLGTFLSTTGKPREGLPYLEKASRLNSANYENAYQLAHAYANAGDYAQARDNLQVLLAQQDKAELHHLLADLDEKQGRPVEAVREYQRAAELAATEPNLFDWGSELLVHSAVEPAIEVFTKGNRLFPNSSRMLMGLAVAMYGRGSYDQAVQSLCQASNLNPNDPAPYLFLGKLQAVDTTPSKDASDRLSRFARLHPENPLANYYYAVGLWRERKGPDDAENSSQIELLLQKAVRLDPNLASAFLQLGILYSEQKNIPKAITAYQNAIEANPRLEQAHYRLSQAYRQAGDVAKAQSELQAYEQVSKEAAEQLVRERHDIQQFVYTLRDDSSVAQPR